MGTAGQIYVYFEIVGNTIYSSNHACHWNWTINCETDHQDIWNGNILVLGLAGILCNHNNYNRTMVADSYIGGMTITFFGFVFVVWLETTLGDINERLRGYLNHNK